MIRQTALPPLTRGRWFPMTWEEFLDWSPDEGQSKWFDPDWFGQDALPEVDDRLLAIAPEVDEAWLLARIRSRRAAGDAP